MNMNNEVYELCLDFVHVYKIAFYEEMENIVYCVHIEIGNAVRCTRKSSGVATSFVDFAALLRQE